MSTSTPNASARTTWAQRLQPLVRGFHNYATWLVGISWKRFFVLSILLLILAGFLQSMPPFSWTMHEVTEEHETPPPPKPPAPPKAREPVIRIETTPKGTSETEVKGVDIRIDENGFRVLKRAAETSPATPGAENPAPQAKGAEPGKEHEIRVDVRRDGQGQDEASIRVSLPEGADTAAIREAIEEAKRAVQEALKEPVIETVEGPSSPSSPSKKVRVSRIHADNALTDLAFLWILASIIIKLTYKGQLQARAEAAQANEAAEAESLKRQLAEARMATMQAQVEPHFLFNTLASIEHLIETDPPRASRMQRALIDLLRATMPSLRDGGVAESRTLGQEQAVIEPYLAILKMRMEERLETAIDIPAGLLSAECPPMMLQMLVENAIKHGLEPQAQGGRLVIQASVVDGQLQLTVSDSGVGLSPTWQASSGTGLKNIRERLTLRYGAAAQLTVEPLASGGTSVVVRLPYRAVSAAKATGETTPTT